MSRLVQKVILLVDSSGSMYGCDIEAVKQSISKFSKSLYKYDGKHSRVDLQIISFSTKARFISRHNIKSIVAEGTTNLADAYTKLDLIFNKRDLFAFRPIVVLFCDGKPNTGNHKFALNKLYKHSAFRNSIRIAFAYGEQDSETRKILRDFTSNAKYMIESPKIDTFNSLLEKTIPKILNREQYEQKNIKKNH